MALRGLGLAAIATFDVDPSSSDPAAGRRRRVHYLVQRSFDQRNV